MSFAADIIRRCRQFILLLRESATSYTTSCLVPGEKSDTLRDALARLVVGLHPLDGPQAVIRVDPAPGLVSLKNNHALQHLGISVEVGRVKNTNKNPVAERAMLELEEELLRQEPGRGPVTELSLAIATARLNSRLRSQGLSSRELWTQRNQFSNEQIPINDLQHILAKQKSRQANHPFSEAAKGGSQPQAPVPPLQVGDLVYVKSDRDKSRTRDGYLIVSIDGKWCFIKKFSGSQLRATSNKVKLSECYAVPHTHHLHTFLLSLHLTTTNVRKLLSSCSCANSPLPHRTCYVRLAQTLQPPPRTTPSTKKTPLPLTVIVFLSLFHLNKDPSGPADLQHTYRSTFLTSVL